MARHKSLQRGLGRQMLPWESLPGLPLPQYHKRWVFMFYCKATKNSIYTPTRLNIWILCRVLSILGQVGVGRALRFLAPDPAQPSGTLQAPTLNNNSLHLELALWRGNNQLARVLQDLNVLR